MVAWLFSRTCAVAKYDPETKAWALKRSSGACDKTGVACGETDSFSLYSAVTIREYDNGAAPRLGCGGGCIALIVTAVVVIVVLGGFVVYKKMCMEPPKDQDVEMTTVNT